MGRITDACPLKGVGSEGLECSSCTKETHCQLIRLEIELELQTGQDLLKKRCGFIKTTSLIKLLQKLSIELGDKYVYLSFSDHFENIGVKFYE